MQRMTDALSRMLNDPSTRNAMRTARANESNDGDNTERRNSVPERLRDREAQDVRQADLVPADTEATRNVSDEPDSSDSNNVSVEFVLKIWGIFDSISTRETIKTI